MSQVRRFFNRNWVQHALTGSVAGLGGLCFTVAGSQLAGLVSRSLEWTWLQWIILVISIVLSIVFLGLLVPRLRTAFAPRFPSLRDDQFSAHIRQRPALIALVSRRDTPKEGETPPRGNPAETAILYHQQRLGAGDPPLKHCWLLYTLQSEPEYKRLAAKYSDVLECHGMPLDSDARVKPHSTYTEVLKAFRAAQTYGFQPDQIIADATGGSVPMSIGMALACRDNGLALEYISAPVLANGEPDFDNAQLVEIDMVSVGAQGDIQAQPATVVASESTSATS